MNESKRSFCARCLTPSTRPRVQFDSEGVCNACRWHEKKQAEIDWPARKEKLKAICDQFRGNYPYDCIVPCSGGKDGTYVSWQLKHEYGMNPLCITFAPPLPTGIGQKNLQNFINSGFNHLMITPDPVKYREMCRWYFVNQGRPKWPFVMGISSAIIQIALRFDIQLIVYGEQGETVYGGAQETEALQKMDRDFLKDIYYEGNDPTFWGFWWTLPTIAQLDGLYVTWWSLFEDWDPEVHAKHAKQHCGFEMLVGGSIGTFTNYAQLDDALQDLHAYMVFLKFGFGRCTSDASIEIRRGRMSREQGIQVVNKLDGTFPWEYLGLYSSFLDIPKDEFMRVLNHFANQDLLMPGDGIGIKPWVRKEPCA